MTILSPWSGSVDLRRSAQNGKSTTRTIWNIMEWKFVISRGMNKDVEEIFEEQGESACHEDMVTGSGTEKSVATKQKKQAGPQSYPVSKTFVPVDHWKWNDISAVDYVSKGSLSWRVSKIMTKMLRHHGLHREDDRVIDWNSLLPTLYRDFERENAGRWSSKEVAGSSSTRN